MALTKSDIMSKISNETGLTNSQSRNVFENLLGVIISTLESGEDVLFSGFGKFSVIEKNVRKGRNPATGSDMMLPARKVVNFKCSGKLRDRINGNE